MKLFLLFFGHYLGDFALQNDFIAKTKQRGSDFWPHTMIAHCFIHGGIVALITGKWWLGALEFVAHFVLDYLKCEKKIDLWTDQILHLIFKVVWGFCL